MINCVTGCQSINSGNSWAPFNFRFLATGEMGHHMHSSFAGCSLLALVILGGVLMFDYPRAAAQILNGGGSIEVVQFPSEMLSMERTIDVYIPAGIVLVTQCDYFQSILQLFAAD